MTVIVIGIRDETLPTYLHWAKLKSLTSAVIIKIVPHPLEKTSSVKSGLVLLLLLGCFFQVHAVIMFFSSFFTTNNNF